MNRRNFLLGLTGLPLATSVLASSLTPKESMTVTFVPPQKSQSTSVDLSLLLHCIAEVETGNDDRKVGKHGERSRYQIKREVWVQHMTNLTTEFGIVHFHAPFVAQCYGKHADLCALRHVQYLDNTIPKASPTEIHFREYVLAWCWNGGLDSWRKVGVPVIRLNNYATRVTNLYSDLLKNRPQRLS